MPGPGQSWPLRPSSGSFQHLAEGLNLTCTGQKCVERGSVPKEVGLDHHQDRFGATLLGFCGNGSLWTKGKRPSLTSLAGTGDMCGELRAQFTCPRSSIVSIVQTSGAVADKTEHPMTLQLLVIQHPDEPLTIAVNTAQRSCVQGVPAN